MVDRKNSVGVRCGEGNPFPPDEGLWGAMAFPINFILF